MSTIFMYGISINCRPFRLFTYGASINRRRCVVCSRTMFPSTGELYSIQVRYFHQPNNYTLFLDDVSVNTVWTVTQLWVTLVVFLEDSIPGHVLCCSLVKCLVTFIVSFRKVRHILVLFYFLPDIVFVCPSRLFSVYVFCSCQFISRMFLTHLFTTIWLFLVFVLFTVHVLSEF